MDVLRLCKELKVESRDNKEDEVGHETDDHHPLASVELVVNQERGKVISTEGDANVDQVVEPTDHDRVVARSNDLDELVLEQLVSVEKDIVGKPSTGGSDQTRSKVAEGELKRSNIVTCNVRLLLGKLELLGCRLHLVVTEVYKPESADSGNGKGHTVGPLGNSLRVGRCGSRVEDQKQDDQDDLVEELAPTLHQESTSDLASTVQAVFLS